MTIIPLTVSVPWLTWEVMVIELDGPVTEAVRSEVTVVLNGTTMLTGVALGGG